ncbi:MAG: glycosyltransferase family 2 protein [Candidatus Woesearchaeota archaeon]|nr:glycosyltransferase family 2 protein [Candidatus Woesearchaeota archaeon]
MNIAYLIFVMTVWFLSTYFMVVLFLVLLTRKNELYSSPKLESKNALPKVSIIVPAYNEGKKIFDSLSSLKKIDYPKKLLEIIIVNDGSKDNTSSVVRKNLSREIKMLPFFNDSKVGAVTVSVEVKNPKNFLEKIIEIEYVIGLSLSLKALSFFNAVHVTPGPFSMYLASALKKIGLFDEKSITEDLEIAYRLQKGHYKIENCTTTRVRTVIPNTLKSLYIQRKRWYSGSLMTIFQHRDVIFDSKIGAFAFVTPYNYVLISLGLSLFFYSAYLLLKNIAKTISFFSLTNFNFFSHLNLKYFDILSINSLTFFGLTSFLITVIGAIICLRLAKKDLRKKAVGMAGYIFLFFLYQVFWASSFYSVLFGRKVKWR